MVAEVNPCRNALQRVQVGSDDALVGQGAQLEFSYLWFLSGFPKTWAQRKVISCTAHPKRMQPSCTKPILRFAFSLNIRIRFLLGTMVFLLALLRAVSASGEDPGSLRLEKEIPLPGVEGRIDHFSADVAGQRLFVAALENGSVEILDTRRGERIAEIKGLKEPQGLYYDSKTERLYVATGGDGKLRVYEGKALTALKTLEFGDDADNVRYDRLTGDIWVGYGNGGIGIVNSTGEKVGSVELGGRIVATLPHGG